MKVKTFRNKKGVLLLLFFAILVSSISPAIDTTENSNSFETNPNASAPIFINSPENKIYRPHVDGFYPATFSFIDEESGTSGTDIEYVDDASISSNCEVKIYDEFLGHKKVLRIHDGTTNGNVAVINYFTSTQKTGIIEWWWSTEVSGSNALAYHFYEGIMGTRAGRVLMQDGNFWDMEDNIVQSYVVNQWYHHRLDFSTNSDKYDWYIDGILVVENGEFLTPVNNFGSTQIKGGWTVTGSCYIDAIGYEWDPNYNIGDNIPLEGYYPGTFGFENNEIGEQPQDWVSSSYGIIQVIPELDGHKNVVEIVDNNPTSGWPGITQYSKFPRTHGTIEFWVRFDSTSEFLQFVSRDTVDNMVVLTIRVEDGKWKYRDNAGTLLNVPIVADPVINKWTHVRIDFRCYNAPSYLGIGNDRCVVSIDGVSSGELEHTKAGKSGYNWFGFSNDPETTMTTWVDAVGFSWDPNYNPGENRHKGILIEFEPDNLPNMHYTLDGGQTEIPISGDTVIPIPITGSYTLTVSGDGYTDGSVSFQTKTLTINSPIDGGIYQEPSDGCYSATYGFDSDTIGEPPSEWDCRTLSGDNALEIVEELDDHDMVYWMRKKDSSDKVETWTTFDTSASSGTVEFWLYKDTDSYSYDPTRISLGGTGGAINFGMQNGQLYIGNWYSTYVGAFTKNTWHHVRVDFDVTQGWKIQIDETWYGGEYGYAFTNTPTDINKFIMSSIYSGDHDDYSAWLDALGYSWNDNYDIGENLYILGYYPGTFGFEDSDAGSDPLGFNVYEGAGSVNVIDQKNGHTKVVELIDTTGSAHAELHNVFQAQTSGTVEFWVLNDDASNAFSMMLLEDSATSIWSDGIGWIQIWEGSIRYWDDTGLQTTTKTIADDTWYHIKIEFECTTGNYEGLAQRKWRFYINGEKFGDFTFRDQIDNVGQIYFATRGSNYNYKCYVDAIGYSWDPYYNVDDNHFLGLLLDFDADNLEWMGYTYDGQQISTILGDKVIPFYDRGTHSIQLIGKDVNGAFFCSKKVWYPCENFNTGFLYAQSSDSHTITSTGSWIDDDVAITSIENPGEYFVIYTAKYQIVDTLLLPDGFGTVKFMVDGVEKDKTIRDWDSMNTALIGDVTLIYGTIIVADKVTIGSGGVNAQIQAVGLVGTLTIMDRSICAIPLKEGYKYDYSETITTWDTEGTRSDPDIELEDLSGTYFAIYTAAFLVSNFQHPLGVHSDGWTQFSDNNGQDLTSMGITRRHWEIPASLYELLACGTLVIADKITLDNSDLNVILRFNQRENWVSFPDMTIGPRSLILIPLENEYKYEQGTGLLEDHNQDIVFEDNEYNCFVMYTATYYIEDDPYETAQGSGWTAFNTGTTTVDYTKRHFDIPDGYGDGLRKTTFVVEILKLYNVDIQVEHYWDPFDNEDLDLSSYRSMILIPFY